MQSTGIAFKFIRLYVLHRASKGTIFGLGILQALREHEIVFSPGTLYPALHDMEKEGLLRSESEIVDGKRRRTYAITVSGMAALDEAKGHLRNLFEGMFENAKI